AEEDGIAEFQAGGGEVALEGGADAGGGTGGPRVGAGFHGSGDGFAADIAGKGKEQGENEKFHDGFGPWPFFERLFTVGIHGPWTRVCLRIGWPRRAIVSPGEARRPVNSGFYEVI